MSFREKTAWISLVTTVGIWGYYFARLVPPLLRGDGQAWDYAGLFVSCVVLSVVVQVVLAIATAIAMPKQSQAPADERERSIELKASGIAYALLSILVATVALAAPFVAGLSLHHFAGDALGFAVLLMANGILLALVAAELARAATQIFHYRRAG